VHKLVNERRRNIATPVACAIHPRVDRVNARRRIAIRSAATICEKSCFARAYPDVYADAAGTASRRVAARRGAARRGAAREAPGISKRYHASPSAFIAICPHARRAFNVTE